MPQTSHPVPTDLPSTLQAKICPRSQAGAAIARLPRPVVFTNGVFDILHRGHVSYLASARALGASLVVGLNFQFTSLLPNLSALDNVALPAPVLARPAKTVANGTNGTI